MANTFGGTYHPIRDDKIVDARAGGRITVEMPCAIPVCKECGEEMALIFQIPWARYSGSPYVGALVFMCDSEDGTCSTWEPASGANAVVLLKDFKLCEPFGSAAYSPFSIEWVAHPDISGDVEWMSTDDPNLARVESEIEAFIEKFGWTKLGGKPIWYQNPEVPVCPSCGGPTLFLAQFDSQLGKDAIGVDVMINFGDCGMGYVFVCANQCSDRGGAFLWQCG